MSAQAHWEPCKAFVLMSRGNNFSNFITVLEEYCFLSAWTFFLPGFIESSGSCVLWDDGEVPVYLLEIIHCLFIASSYQLPFQRQSLIF